MLENDLKCDQCKSDNLFEHHYGDNIDLCCSRCDFRKPINQLSKEESKEVIKLVVACNGIIGYLSALDDFENITPQYVERLKNYYIKNLEEATKIFMDKM